MTRRICQDPEERSKRGTADEGRRRRQTRLAKRLRSDLSSPLLSASLSSDYLLDLVMLPQRSSFCRPHPARTLHIRPR